MCTDRPKSLLGEIPDAIKVKIIERMSAATVTHTGSALPI